VKIARMPAFTSYDGTLLAYHLLGTGEPLICLPGGPMRASVYLGDLGGLSAHRQLVLLDLRGTGESAEPADRDSYRCDRQVADVEALREHLGLERVDLLAHSAGGSLAVQYAAAHPERVGRLALVAPSTRAVGIPLTGDDRREIAALRKDEPWYERAFAAFEAIEAGTETDDDWDAIQPFSYGRWDEASQAFDAAEADQCNEEAGDVFGAEGVFDPDATRAALATLAARVLIVAGEWDWGMAPKHARELGALFAGAADGTGAEVAVQPGAGHFPWLDDAERFVATLSGFLA
jgi:proline iminopeptidase